MKTKLKTCKGCCKDKVIWKVIDGEKYCKNCFHRLFPNNYTKLKPISNKLKPLDAEYLKIRHQYLLQNPFCKASLPNCTRYSTDIHHMEKRGKNLSNEDTFLPVCRTCHSWIEDHKKEARELGFQK